MPASSETQRQGDAHAGDHGQDEDPGLPRSLHRLGDDQPLEDLQRRLHLRQAVEDLVDRVSRTWCTFRGTGAGGSGLSLNLRVVGGEGGQAVAEAVGDLRRASIRGFSACGVLVAAFRLPASSGWRLVLGPVVLALGGLAEDCRSRWRSAGWPRRTRPWPWPRPPWPASMIAPPPLLVGRPRLAIERHELLDQPLPRLGILGVDLGVVGSASSVHLGLGAGTLGHQPRSSRRAARSLGRSARARPLARLKPSRQEQGPDRRSDDRVAERSTCSQ